MTGRRGAGSLAIVLHAHMPFVLGHGTWPFGEEWLWEAVATSYLPLLDVLDAGAPLTLSVTPVLADQLEAPEARERCLVFMEELRATTHRLDAEELTAEGRLEEAAAVSLSAATYERSADRFRELGGDLLMAFGQHSAWTSAATHEVLALAAVDGAVRMQVETGIASHRRRFGGWDGGFWLPECAHASWLDRLLAEAGVRATVVDWTDVLGFGHPGNLQPRQSMEGPLLVPLDRQLVDLVWAQDGYPSAPEYRNHHGLTTHHHRAWSNDGKPYDPVRALEAARRDAASFVSSVIARLAEARATVKDPLAVFAADAELFGHWWHEGVDWLSLVAAEARERDLLIEPLDAALQARRPGALPEALPQATSWGRGRDLRTWSGEKGGEFAWRIRSAELALRSRGADGTALRELMALEASDWAFLADAATAGDYPQERSRAHRDGALGAVGSGADSLNSLAPDLRSGAFFTP